MSATHTATYSTSLMSMPSPRPAMYYFFDADVDRQLAEYEHFIVDSLAGNSWIDVGPRTNYGANLLSYHDRLCEAVCGYTSVHDIVETTSHIRPGPLCGICNTLVPDLEPDFKTNPMAMDTVWHLSKIYRDYCDTFMMPGPSAIEPTRDYWVRLYSDLAEFRGIVIDIAALGV